MLELPESAVIARQIDEILKGQTIASVVAGHSPHGFAWFYGDPATYYTLLCGRKIDGAAPRAGQIEISAGEMRIVVHDGVNPRYYPAGAKRPEKHQLLIEFEEGGALICTVQMYGGMFVFLEGGNDNPYYLMAGEKPSPLTDAFDRAYFDTLVAEGGPKLSAKAFLATQQRIPGLGNGCLQDILFTARIHPKTKMGSLSPEELDNMYGAVKDVLAEMTARGGRDTEKDLFGNPGGYRTNLSSKTLPYPCPGCGGGIVRKAYMGGNVYYCPSCQPER